MKSPHVFFITLGLAIVGLGFIFGANIHHANREVKVKEVITDDCMYIASAAQGYYETPASFGGGDRSYRNFDIAKAGMTESGEDVRRKEPLATYKIKGNEKEFTVTGVPKSDERKAVILAVKVTKSGEKRLSVSYRSW